MITLSIFIPAKLSWAFPITENAIGGTTRLNLRMDFVSGCVRKSGTHFQPLSRQRHRFGSDSMRENETMSETKIAIAWDLMGRVFRRAKSGRLVRMGTLKRFGIDYFGKHRSKTDQELEAMIRSHPEWAREVRGFSNG